MNGTGTKARVQVLDATTYASESDSKARRLIGFGLCPECCSKLEQEGRLTNEGSTVRRAFKCGQCGTVVLAVYELTLATVSHGLEKLPSADPLVAGDEFAEGVNEGVEPEGVR